MSASSAAQTRRAVLPSRPERPLGVAVISGLLWLATAAIVLGAVGAMISLSARAAEDQRQRVGGVGTDDVVTGSFVSVIFLLAAAGLAWVGAANAAGRPWAWTAVSAGAVVLVVPAVIAFFVFVGLTIAYEHDEELSFLFAGAAAGCVLLAIALPFLTRYYRRDPVREFFGRTRSAPGHVYANPH